MAINTDAEFTVDKWAAQQQAEKVSKAGNANPNATLDKNAFMTLLLTELQYQDPTDPMDTGKMLEQTTQLTTLEMQENTNKVMLELAEQMKSSYALTSISALGKMANFSNSISKDEDSGQIDFNLYFDLPAMSGDVEIYDSKGNIIRSMPFDALNGGVNAFRWDGKTDGGEDAEAGEYLIKATYLGADGENYEAPIGRYPVEAIKFDQGVAFVKVAGEYVEMSKVNEFTY